MANWLNLRLVVTGAADDVKQFRRAAGAVRGRTDTRRSEVFTAEMEFGEGGDLHADGVHHFGGTFDRVKYRFQGRNDDYCDHFQEISRRFPKLAFVLVFSDPNGGAFGSYLLRNGRRRAWNVPSRLQESIINNLRHEYGIRGDDDPDLYWVEDEAFVEMMDLAQRKWDATVAKWLCDRQKHRQKRRLHAKPARPARQRLNV